MTNKIPWTLHGPFLSLHHNILNLLCYYFFLEGFKASNVIFQPNVFKDQNLHQDKYRSFSGAAFNQDPRRAIFQLFLVLGEGCLKAASS